MRNTTFIGPFGAVRPGPTGMHGSRSWSDENPAAGAWNAVNHRIGLHATVSFAGSRANIRTTSAVDVSPSLRIARPR